jgi:hypothetical protein
MAIADGNKKGHRTVKALWRGELPLARAFWEYAVVYVALANLFATGAALSVLAAGLPALLAAVLYLLPVPYIVIAVVGVWRSADAYKGPQHWARLARLAALVWGGLMGLI